MVHERPFIGTMNLVGTLGRLKPGLQTYSFEPETFEFPLPFQIWRRRLALGLAKRVFVVVVIRKPAELVER